MVMKGRNWRDLENIDLQGPCPYCQETVSFCTMAEAYVMLDAGLKEFHAVCSECKQGYVAFLPLDLKAIPLYKRINDPHGRTLTVDQWGMSFECTDCKSTITFVGTPADGQRGRFGIQCNCGRIYIGIIHRDGKPAQSNLN